MAQLLNHLHIVFYTFLDALSLDVVAHIFEKLNLHQKVVLNVVDGVLGLFLRGDEEVGWIYLILFK